MAADFYTLQGVSDIAQEGQQALNVLSTCLDVDTDVLVWQAIAHIQEKIKQLKDAENNFLQHFNCSSIKEFKERVKAYYNEYNLVNYTGVNLRKYTNEYKALTNLSKQQLADDMNTVLYNLFQQNFATGQVAQDLQDVFQGKEITEAAAQRIVSLLIEQLSSFGVGTLQSTDFFTLTASIKANNNRKVDDTYLFKLCADLTTKTFQKDMSNLKKIAQGELTQITGKTGKTGKTTTIQVDNALKNKAQQLIQSNVQSTKITSASMETTFVVDWSRLIKEATNDNSGKASELKYAKDSEELRQINEQITDMIVSDLGINSKLQNYAKKRITEMWQPNQDPTMFFIGNASSKLTGVLGEINAMIALSKLLGSKFDDKILHWVGSNMTGGKQPSIDIALAEIGNFSYGIQVKNTAMDLKTDLSHYINFADKSIDSILESLDIPSGGEAIKNVYISDVFNVPYKRKGRRYVQVGYDTSFVHTDPAAIKFHLYTIIDKVIDDIVNKINLYFTRFASDFLYIGFENEGKGFESALAALDAEVSLAGNFVYIVGQEVFFASELLEELQEQLEILQELQKLNEQTSFKLEAYFGDLKGDQDSSFNIVSKLNGAGSLSAHTIKMRSSWGFHK